MVGSKHFYYYRLQINHYAAVIFSLKFVIPNSRSTWPGCTFLENARRTLLLFSTICVGLPGCCSCLGPKSCSLKLWTSVRGSNTWMTWCSANRGKSKEWSRRWGEFIYLPVWEYCPLTCIQILCCTWALGLDEIHTSTEVVDVCLASRVQ